MSTKCAIAIENPDETYRAIYCHYDGYPAGVGKVLAENYTTAEKVNQLLDLGNLSVLGAEPKAGWWDYPQTRPEGLCESYRERGEKNTEAKTFQTAKEMIRYYEDCECEYFYIFREVDYSYGYDNGNFTDTDTYHEWFFTQRRPYEMPVQAFLRTQEKE